jgi:hypothetical protein
VTSFAVIKEELHGSIIPQLRLLDNLLVIQDVVQLSPQLAQHTIQLLNNATLLLQVELPPPHVHLPHFAYNI